MKIPMKLIEDGICLGVGALAGVVATKVAAKELKMPKPMSKKEKELVEDLKVEDLNEGDEDQDYKEA